jgi:hypothetical protein
MLSRPPTTNCRQDNVEGNTCFDYRPILDVLKRMNEIGASMASDDARDGMEIMMKHCDPSQENNRVAIVEILGYLLSLGNSPQLIEEFSNISTGPMKRYDRELVSQIHQKTMEYQTSAAPKVCSLAPRL